MDKLIESVMSYLTGKYKCHTMILYGSYAEGDFTVESDLDILCFSDEVEDMNETAIVEGVQLDAWIVNTTQLDVPKEYLHITGNKVLLDERGKAGEFIESIKELFEEGTEPISDNQREFLKGWLSKMQKRSLRDDTEGSYRYHWMLKDSLEIYFELNNRWFLGVKKSLKWLEQNDPKAYRLFVSALKGNVGCTESEELIKYIIGI